MARLPEPGPGSLAGDAQGLADLLPCGAVGSKEGDDPKLEGVEGPVKIAQIAEQAGQLP